jgi:hypothetical protein
MLDLWHLVQKLPADYDNVVQFVVRADGEAAARKMASEKAGDEGPVCWTNPSCSTCKRLPRTGKAGVIVRHFRPG